MIWVSVVPALRLQQALLDQPRFRVKVALHERGAHALRRWHIVVMSQNLYDLATRGEEPFESHTLYTAKPGKFSPSRARSGLDAVILAPRPAILALGPAVFHHSVFARPRLAHRIGDSVTGFLDFDRDGECCLAHFCVTSTRITGKLEAFHFTDDGSGNRFSKTSIAARSSSNAGRVKRPYWGVLNRYCRSLQAFRSATIAM